MILKDPSGNFIFNDDHLEPDDDRPRGRDLYDDSDVDEERFSDNGMSGDDPSNFECQGHVQESK